MKMKYMSNDEQSHYWMRSMNFKRRYEEEEEGVTVPMVSQCESCMHISLGRYDLMFTVCTAT